MGLYIFLLRVAQLLIFCVWPVLIGVFFIKELIKMKRTTVTLAFSDYLLVFLKSFVYSASFIIVLAVAVVIYWMLNFSG